ncbi:hypothetical protein BST13_27555 [Mycobacterium aquaticum]|uniref:Uncharacterized protein n=2 Tax=Mycobacterium aquaticum TaxID=1927124 RepID=A0A1X0AHL9_9MYCO|nr:hypothetical protein BST13_27555 [Mycobacterium aquaticum]
MEVSLQSLERGVDETRQHLWGGEAADQFTASVVDELIEARALLDEIRATVAAPPWGCAAG